MLQYIKYLNYVMSFTMSSEVDVIFVDSNSKWSKKTVKTSSHMGSKLVFLQKLLFNIFAISYCVQHSKVMMILMSW